jgi:predicted secreted protein
MDKESTPELSYEFTKSEYEEWDHVLPSQNYLNPEENDKKCVAVITYKNNKASMKQYLIENNGTIHLTVPEDSNYIISLHANSTVAYTWNIMNEYSDKVLHLDQRSWTKTPMPEEDNGKVGVSYDRQNFYFRTIASCREKLVMRYEHQSEEREEFFEATFKVKIE